MITEFAGLNPGTSFYAGSYRGAMASPAVNRCVSLLAGLIGSAPLHAYRDAESPEGGRASRVTPTPMMLTDPSPFDTYAVTMSNWAMDLLLDGNAIGVVATRDLDGVPTSFMPVPARMVGVRYMDAAAYGAPVLAGFREYDINGRTYPQWDVLHVKGLHEPGCLRGVGVLEAALCTVQQALELDRQARGIAQNGVPTGVLAVDPTAAVSTPQDLKDAKRAWLDAQRTRTIAALAPGVSFQPISWNAQEMQLVEARKFSDVQVAQLFGVPLRYLGHDTGGLQYSTPEADSQTLLTYTLNQWLVRFEQAISGFFPPGVWARFSRESFLSIDPSTRYALHASALGNGWRTINEVRDFEDLPRVEWGDDRPFTTYAYSESSTETESVSTSVEAGNV